MTNCDETSNNKKEDPKVIIEDIKNIDIVNECSIYLNIDKEFNSAITKGILTDNLISNIINIKYIETLYGNPNKEDLNVNDALFIILESVFGLTQLFSG